MMKKKVDCGYINESGEKGEERQTGKRKRAQEVPTTTWEVAEGYCTRCKCPGKYDSTIVGNKKDCKE